MKICPFISHLLGDENHNTLSLGEKTTDGGQTDASDDVVLLGYDNEEGVGSNKDGTNVNAASAQLECLKESCRFYQTASDECRFDMIFSKIDGFEQASAELSPELMRDIDKIWQFQTKGVAEIVESLADSDKKQADSLDTLKSEVTDRLEKLNQPGDGTDIESIQKEIESLRDSIKERGEGFDNLSTTVSELADNVARLKDMSDDVSKKVADIDGAIPKESTINEILERSAKKTAEGLKALDFSEPVKSISQKVDDVLGAQKESAEDLGKKLDSWKEDIVDRVLDLASRQEDWETRINELVDHQKELAGYLEEGKKHREDEQSRSTKKESKKYNNLGVTSFHNGAYEMARDQFLQAVKMDPDFAEAYNNLGLAFTELDDEEKATDAFTKAVELNSSLHAAYNNLGYIFYKKGDYEQAVEMYNEALGKNSKNGPAYTNLGNAYYRMDRLNEASDAWTKALELDPGNEKAKRNLQRISETAK